ncbi:MAG: hypothetical protein ABSG43_00305 [Solirubrobacteraceae bacterium]|jgi:hypothetical protein
MTTPERLHKLVDELSEQEAKQALQLLLRDAAMISRAGSTATRRG